MAMATSPSRLDPPRVAILPTATPGNNNSVLIPKVHMSTKKRKMCVERATARQPREQLWRRAVAPASAGPVPANPARTHNKHRRVRAVTARCRSVPTTATGPRCHPSEILNDGFPLSGSQPEWLTSPGILQMVFA